MAATVAPAREDVSRTGPPRQKAWSQEQARKGDINVGNVRVWQSSPPFLIWGGVKNRVTQLQNANAA